MASYGKFFTFGLSKVILKAREIARKVV